MRKSLPCNLGSTGTKAVQYVVYRYLTHADYNNMYRPKDMISGGGGQKYIDFPTGSVSLADWQRFLAEPPVGINHVLPHNRHRWENVPVRSIGLPDTEEQLITIYQRRDATIAVAEQHIEQVATRIRAWHPDHGFPEPTDRRDIGEPEDGLSVFLAKTHDGDIWAGWFLNPRQFPVRQDAVTLLEEMLAADSESGDAGFLSFQEDMLLLDENSALCPLIAGLSEATTDTEQLPAGVGSPSASRLRRRRQRTEEEIVESLFGEDDDCETADEGVTREVTIRVRQRNQIAVKDLKDLYRHQCQIASSEFTFPKKDGIPYTEAHHLIPLGSGGADNPRNIIIVSPLIHRMLHYADVSDIDLSQVRENADGSASLVIQINGVDYTIRWSPQHAERVMRHQEQERD